MVDLKPREPVGCSMVICFSWGCQVAFLLKSALNRLDLSGGRLQGKGFM
jgi:hypothetical protein